MSDEENPEWSEPEQPEGDEYEEQEEDAGYHEPQEDAGSQEPEDDAGFQEQEDDAEFQESLGSYSEQPTEQYPGQPEGSHSEISQETYSEQPEGSYYEPQMPYSEQAGESYIEQPQYSYPEQQQSPYPEQMQWAYPEEEGEGEQQTGVEPERQLPYFLPSEVVIHNTEDDCWVSVLGKVFNLTPLLREYRGKKCVKSLLAFAGKDLSHLFDKCTGDVRYYTHAVTGLRVPYTPHGTMPHVSLVAPTARWEPVRALPWWKSPRYHIGFLTEKPRPLRIIDTRSGFEHKILVCKEETVRDIIERESKWNAHVKSYTAKYDRRVLDLDKTLEENGIEDERERFTDAGLPTDTYVPAILLYYNDDLTVA